MELEHRNIALLLSGVTLKIVDSTLSLSFTFSLYFLYYWPSFTPPSVLDLNYSL